jgi:hypothetical protein
MNLVRPRCRAGGHVPGVGAKMEEGRMNRGLTALCAGQAPGTSPGCWCWG